LKSKTINLYLAASPLVGVFTNKPNNANKQMNLLKDFHIMAQETEPLIVFFNKPPALVGENTNKREEGGKREGWSHQLFRQRIMTGVGVVR
jgi:hypothetical protein